MRHRPFMHAVWHRFVPAGVAGPADRMAAAMAIPDPGPDPRAGGGER
jgi:hypothetical protein